MAQYKTPGVYLVEKDAFPNSVVEVATAIPAFIGYTEKAANGNQSLIRIPRRISSFTEYLLYFGGLAIPRFSFKQEVGQAYELELDPNTHFLLYYSMRLYFDNGGGPCYVVSAGLYSDVKANGRKGEDYTDCLAALTKELEPTLLVAPDVNLLEDAEWQDVMQQFLKHCQAMQNRIAIFDVPGGDKPRSYDNEDVITAFRTAIGVDFLSYGAAYYPWVNSSIVGPTDVNFSVISHDTLDAFITALTDQAKIDFAGRDAKVNPIVDKIKQIKKDLPESNDNEVIAPLSPEDKRSLQTLHQTIAAVSPLYMQVMEDMRKRLNLLPPSAAMAGVYARIDSTQGVFKAPANTTLNSVVSPAVTIAHDDQEDLNMPLDGKAINAIRTFPNRGVLAWGARTLDGNSQDWRYLNVRRTIIMLEQSIKYAMQAYVFEPNTSSTWVTVKSVIDNFLNNQWKAGGLAGATPEEAFSVSVGLGSTMVPNDILDGLMKVMVKVALVRPAEFIEITFQQQMQTS